MNIEHGLMPEIKLIFQNTLSADYQKANQTSTPQDNLNLSQQNIMSKTHSSNALTRMLNKIGFAKSNEEVY